MYFILIADDDADIRNLVKETLTRKEFECITADNGISVLEKLVENKIDLIISDIMMPKLDGFNLIREIRKTSNVPIIILSARGDDMDKILGLGIGADDYLVKPVNMDELVARTEAHLRRNKIYDTSNAADQVIKAGQLTLDKDKSVLMTDGKEITLVAKEYKLIVHFMENQEKILTKKQLYNAVWEDEYCYDDNTINATLSRLRSKINLDGHNYIQTIRGLGYKFSAKDEN